MRLAALLVVVPLAASAQESPPAPPQESPPAPPQQYAPPQQQPQEAPQYPPPAGEYQPQQAAPAQYPPPPQYAPPPQGAPQYPPPPGANPMREKERGSWYIGFSTGVAGGSIKDGYGEASFDKYMRDWVGTSPTSVFGGFKIGATLSPKLLLGFDVTAASVQGEGTNAVLGPNTKIVAQINNYDVVATFFPMERGPFFRGGVGLSGFALLTDSPAGKSTNTYTGTNALAGVGYAFWLGRSFNLTVNLDFSAQKYGSSTDPVAPSSSTFWSAYAGFDWY